ncbi:hypothetical protein Mal48_35680 [Thalassoglobus polymorphus]|uniref:Uncharacterized protein n=1 Tax=Thalassoglobus polymorphus TaxID=2527994 RepID=A0A517QRR8_9PLAN|nr:hypothetical protein Mal48_35680 [Thalassoglobus polymorphus]
MDAWKIPQSSHSRLDRNFLMDALPSAREELISLVKMLFATRQVLRTSSKDALEPVRKSLESLFFSTFERAVSGFRISSDIYGNRICCLSRGVLRCS